MAEDGSSSRLALSPSEATPPKGERREVRLLKQRKKRDDALCLLICSGLCLCLSGVFFALSFRLNYLRERCFIPGSLEFVVCLIAFVSFAILFGFGLCKLIRSVKQIKALGGK